MINKNDDLFHKLEVAESILGRIKVLHDKKMEKWQNSQNNQNQKWRIPQKELVA